MSIAIIWLLTILTSIGMDVSLTLQLIKDIASEGYKLDITRIVKFQRNIPVEQGKIYTKLKSRKISKKYEKAVEKSIKSGKI